MYCNVAVPVPVEGPFTYEIPPKLRDAVTPGVRVVVPFAGRMLTGIVTEFALEPPAAKLQAVVRVLDAMPVLGDDLLKLAKWITTYYQAPEGEVLKTMLPLGVEVETRRVVRLTAAGENFVSPVTEALKKRSLAESIVRRRFGLADADLRKLERAGLVERVSEARERAERPEFWVTLGQGFEDVPRKREQRVVQLLLSETAPWRAAELAERANVPASLLRDMATRGVLIMERRDLRSSLLVPRSSFLTLNPGQETTLTNIRDAMAAKKYATFLLEGVTGSGKTEIYLRAIEEVLAAGGGALMLVPEISLTPAMAEQFVSRFGDAVAILHSGFAGRERSREWRRVHSGEARVVVGTRSAVFAPLARLDLVIVDEEQDSSYKQEDTPRYNGRDVAVVRARNAGAVAVLGSATPSLESRYNTERGKYQALQLHGRVENRPMAEVAVVDMRQEFREKGKTSIFSERLTAEIAERLEAREQVMILLNRRGFSAFVICRSCGSSIQCENCSIALTHHRSQNRLLCHYCDHHMPVPQACPKCNSEYLYFMGQGTERIEDLLAARFPHARIARLDRDTARGRQQYERILGDFRAGVQDILVGTQMIAKGHDIHNVTLVGVISADTALGLPDFRAAERTFQLLTQVAGRAGRGTLPGRVILQTYYPEHYAIQCAAAQNYQAFYEKELRFRRLMHYPPFNALAAILVRSPKLEAALKMSGLISGRIAQGAWKGVRVLGPAAAPLLRLKRDYRYQFLIKSQRHDTLQTLLHEVRACAKEADFPATGLVIDVDPFNLL